MCGIAGSFDRQEAFSLYEENLKRGRYSAGLLIVNGEGQTVIKRPTCFTLNDIPDGGYQYLFHSRAPTSRTLEYREVDTHPFIVDGLYAAHNGIISNADQLAQQYEVDYSLDSASMVDSYLIPYIIRAKQKFKNLTLTAAVAETFTELKGTFGVWLYDSETAMTLLARGGSTLYADMENGAFSSSPVDGFTMIDDGTISLVDPVGVTIIDTFKYKPTYFFAK